MGYHRLEHEVLRGLKEELPTTGTTLILAVSGGLDSMVMLSAFVRLKASLKNFTLQAVHFHHGQTIDKKLQAFRDQAALLVEGYCRKSEIPLHTIRAPKPLQTESQFKSFREQHYKKLVSLSSPSFVLQAHHLEDLLETRLIQLIRGIQDESYRQIGLRNGFKYRPFLKTSRPLLAAYQKDHNVPFLEDPSNQNSLHFRNWIRHHWLPLLESQKPGAVKSLGRSLEALGQPSSEDKNLQLMKKSIQKNRTISRSQYQLLNAKDQRRALGCLAGVHGARLTHPQIVEIQKQLEHAKKQSTLEVGGLRWDQNLTLITCEPKKVSPQGQ